VGLGKAGAAVVVCLTTPGKTAVAAATAPTVAAPENRLRRDKEDVLEDIKDSWKKGQLMGQQNIKLRQKFA
jgi:hypothetical protein